MPVRLTVILPTFDRAASLSAAIAALLNQTADPGTYQLIVVDNNSTDGTRSLLESLAADTRVRVLRESRQGLSFARNTGLAAGRGDLVAFTDDDVEVGSDWVSTVVHALDADAAVDGIGGRVLPAWRMSPPGWLTREHWAPLALQDHGPESLLFDATRPIGLVGANVAFRRAVFDRIGGFAEHVQRVKDGAGSTEDHEFLTRLFASGGRMRYLPGMLVVASVQPERCARAYHRRWHQGHGRFHAQMREPAMERSRAAVLGVPVHLIRAALVDIMRLAGCAFRREREAAFLTELRLRFFRGFATARVRDMLTSAAATPGRRHWRPSWLARGER